MSEPKDPLPYTAAEREIYSYTDGGSRIAADPAVLWRNFRRAQRESGTDYQELFAEARSIQESLGGETPDQAILERQDMIFEKIADLGRAIFGKPRLQPDGSGWTDSEAFAQLSEFLEWQHQLQGKAETSPSGSDATAGPPAASVDEVARASITPLGTDSI